MAISSQRSPWSSGSQGRIDPGQEKLRRGVLAGAVVLSFAASSSAEAAKAFSCSFGEDLAFPGSCKTGIDYDVSGTSLPTTNTMLNLKKLPTKGNGTISFAWIPIAPSPGYARDLWRVNVAFDPAPLQPDDGLGLFEYSLRLDPGFLDPSGIGGWTFRDEQLALSNVNPARVTEQVYGDSGFTTLLSTLKVPLSPDGFRDGSAGRSQIWVRNTYEAIAEDDEVGTISNFQNNFRQQRPLLTSTLRQQPQSSEVPGPLPLLGVSTAFALSRGLRRRLRCQRPEAV